MNIRAIAAVLNRHNALSTSSMVQSSMVFESEQLYTDSELIGLCYEDGYTSIRSISCVYSGGAGASWKSKETYW